MLILKVFFNFVDEDINFSWSCFKSIYNQSKINTLKPTTKKLNPKKSSIHPSIPNQNPLTPKPFKPLSS